MTHSVAAVAAYQKVATGDQPGRRVGLRPGWTDAVGAQKADGSTPGVTPMQQATQPACPHCGRTLDDLEEPLADHINNSHRSDRDATGETRRGP